jgi:hypothetical protein
MARFAGQTRVTAEATLTLTEIEMRALDALFCYGVDSLLKAFYKDCGTTYMKPYEAGLRTLAEGVGRDLKPIIKRAEQARAVFKKEPT